MAQFDVEGAKAAGYSDEDIARLQTGISAAKAAGYSDEEIAAHLQAGGAAPSAAAPAFTRYTLGSAKDLAAGAVTATGLPGTALSVLPHQGLRGTTGNFAGNLFGPSTEQLERAADLGVAPPHAANPVQFSDLFPTMGQQAEAAGGLGLQTAGTPLAPQGYGEGLFRGGIKGTGAMLPMLAAGGPVLPLLASGFLGGVGGEALGDPRVGGPAGAVVGGFMGGNVAHGGSALLDMYRTGPGAVRRTAGGIPGTGMTRSFESAGDVAKNRAWEYMANEQPRRIDALWQPVDGPGGFINPATTGVPLHDFEHTLGQIAAEGGSLSNVVQHLPSGSRMQGIANNYGNTLSGSLGIVPTWQDVRQLRTAIGDAMKDPGIPGSKAEEHLQNLYRSVTSDLRASAHGVAPEAGAAFDTANEETTRLLDFRDKVLKRFVSADTPNLAKDPASGTAVQKLLKDSELNSGDLRMLRQEMPDVANHVAASMLKSDPTRWLKLNEASQAALIPDAATRELLSEAVTHIPKGGKMAQTIASALPFVKFEVGQGAGEILGHYLSQYGHALGTQFFESPGIGNTIRLAGGAAPFVYDRLRNALVNPGSLKLPVAGAVAGGAGNALGVVPTPGVSPGP